MGGSSFGGPGKQGNGTGLNGVYWDWDTGTMRTTDAGNVPVSSGYANNRSSGYSLPLPLGTELNSIGFGPRGVYIWQKAFAGVGTNDKDLVFKDARWRFVPGSGANSAGARVFIEMDGIGHAYIELNGTVFSYGRYDGSYSPASGRFGPIGPGIMMRYKGREAEDFIKLRTSKYPTNVYSINNAYFNSTNAYDYLNNLYWSGSTNKTGGRDIGTYLIIGSNCATIVCDGLNAGGMNINYGTPSTLNNYLNSNGY